MKSAFSLRWPWAACVSCAVWQVTSSSALNQPWDAWRHFYHPWLQGLLLQAVWEAQPASWHFCPFEGLKQSLPWIFVLLQPAIKEVTCTHSYHRHGISSWSRIRLVTLGNQLRKTVAFVYTVGFTSSHSFAQRKFYLSGANLWHLPPISPCLV